MKMIQLVLVSILALSLVACGKKPVDAPAEAADAAAPAAVAESQAPAAGADACAPAAVADIEIVEISPGLTSRMLMSGCGDVAQVGQVAAVHYTGWLFDEEAENNRGAKFDSSHDRNQHFSFPLGGGRVIKGWDLGVQGMAIGEVRELTIAPDLAYGDRDIGVIPPGSTLVFEVELAALEGTGAAAQ